MTSYICLHGLSSQVQKKLYRTHAKDYYSRWICCQHTSCVAVPCMWPVDQLAAEWKKMSTCRSNLVAEATRCYKCFKAAKYLCVYGGHMVCAQHVYPNHEWKTKTKSPFFCCGPVWPNPWRHMHIDDTSDILEHDTVGRSASYNKDMLRLCRASCDSSDKIQITMWAHPTDNYPRQEFLPRFVVEKHLQVWRISLCQLPATMAISQLTLQRCHIFWVTASLKANLNHILKRYNTLPRNSKLYIHRQRFYMLLQYEAAKQVECVVCQQKQHVDDFVKSSCCLSPLDEMEPWPSLVVG